MLAVFGQEETEMIRAGQIAFVAAWIGLVSPAGADAPSAMEVLKKAQAAAKGLDALEYEAEFRCGGVMTSFLRDQAGKVTLARGSNAPPRLRLDATMLPADEKGSLTFQMASDGVMNYVIDHREKRYVCADMHDSSAVMGMPPTGLLMPALADWLPDATADRVQIGLRIAAWVVLALAWGFFALFLARNRRLFTPAVLG